MSNVYTPETLEHYYKMRKKASTGNAIGSSLKKLSESNEETAKPEPHGHLVADFLGKKSPPGSLTEAR